MVMDDIEKNNENGLKTNKKNKKNKDHN